MGYKNINQPSKIVLKVDNMKQYGKDFSLKISNSFNGFRGIIETTIESEKNRLTVIGKLDPWEVRERVEKVTKKKVEFISPGNPPKKEAGGGATAIERVKPPKKKEADSGATAIKLVKPKQDNQLSRLISDDRKHRDRCALMMENFVKESKGVVKAKYHREHVEKITYNKVAEGNGKMKGAAVEPVRSKQLVVSTVVLKVRLDCGGCVLTARNTLLQVQGVKKVTADAEKDLVTVEGTNKMDVNSLVSCLKKKLNRSVEIVRAKAAVKPSDSTVEQKIYVERKVRMIQVDVEEKLIIKY